MQNKVYLSLRRGALILGCVQVILGLGFILSAVLFNNSDHELQARVTSLENTIEDIYEKSKSKELPKEKQAYI